MAKLPGVYDIFNNTWFEYCQSAYITSDPHFGEPDLKIAFPNRPNDEELVKRINAVCGKTDCLIILGDCGDTSYVSRLRAKCKILIQGNHDAGKTNYQRTTYFHNFKKALWQKEEALTEMKYNYPDCRYTIESFEDYWAVTADNMLFDAVFEGPLMLGEKLILSHEPVNIPWAYNLHGHQHNGPLSADNLHRNVALEVNDYKPVNLKTVITSGVLGNIQSLHRITVDKATSRAEARGYTLKEKVERCMKI